MGGESDDEGGDIESIVDGDEESVPGTNICNTIKHTDLILILNKL